MRKQKTGESLLIAQLLALLVTGGLTADEKGRSKSAYPPLLPGAKVEPYKQVDDVNLNVYIFQPADWQASDKRAAIVFFFGGGWRGGNPIQFYEQAKYFASRGMVAMTADYRVRGRHGTLADACVADAKSAIRWVRKNAKRLGVDPQRIVASGGSAGGHLAACTGVVPGFDERGEDPAISSTPDAMALFNPAVVLAPVDGVAPLSSERMAQLPDRMGVDPVQLSPYHNVKNGAPPTIIFHGTADKAVPYKTVELFTAAMKKADSRCELIGYDGKPHGFFNYGRGDGTSYLKTTRALDAFLVSLGYLEGTSTLRSSPRKP